MLVTIPKSNTMRSLLCVVTQFIETPTIIWERVVTLKVKCKVVLTFAYKMLTRKQLRIIKEYGADRDAAEQVV